MSIYEAFEYVMDHYTPIGLGVVAPRKDTYAMISIQSSNNHNFGLEFTKNKYCKDVLTLYFDDIEKNIKGATLFNNKMASQIIEFVGKYINQVDTIVVHCYSGLSRSKAVGAFIEKITGNNNATQLKTGIPNMYVYNMLDKTYEKNNDIK